MLSAYKKLTMKHVIVFVLVVYSILAVPVHDLDEKFKTHENVSVTTSNFGQSFDQADKDINIPQTRHLENGEDNLKFETPNETSMPSKPNLKNYTKSDIQFNQVIKNCKNENNKPKINNEEPQLISSNRDVKNDTELSKTAGELEFPDRIGTPAIISLQGPPGK